MKHRLDLLLNKKKFLYVLPVANVRGNKVQSFAFVLSVTTFFVARLPYSITPDAARQPLALNAREND